MAEVTGGHHGVPDDVLNLLGKVTVSAAWVEHVGREIANAFNTPDTGKMQFEKLMEEVKDRMRSPGRPPWARVDDDDIRGWISRARQAMHRRNAYVHGMANHVSKDGKWDEHGVIKQQIGDGYAEATDEELEAARVHHNRMLGHDG